MPTVSRSIAHFDELGVHRLLSLQTDKSELRSFTDDVLKSLSADNAEAADLRLTLQTLLDCNCNVAEASRALHMHYNTLRYRIGKLESVVGSIVFSGSNFRCMTTVWPSANARANCETPVP